MEGLAFYIDRTYRTQRADNGEIDIGFLAPYAYLNVSIVEAPTLRVITGLPVRASSVRSPVRNKETVLNPWEALSSAEKVQLLRDMVRREVSTAVAKAIQSLPARP